MKKLLVVVAVLLVAVLMTQTVPDKQRHKEAMMEAVTEFVDEEAETSGFGDNLLTNIGKGVIIKTVELALNTKLRVHNYYLFNTTYVHVKGKDQTLSVGLFGHVFTFDKEMLRDKLQEALDNKDEIKAEKADAKQSARELRKLQREQRRREKELKREQERREKEAKKEAKRLEKEAKRKAKEAEKEAKRKAKEAEKAAKK